MSDPAGWDKNSWTVECGIISSGTATCDILSCKVSSGTRVRCGKVNWRILGRYKFCSGVTARGGANAKIHWKSYIISQETSWTSSQDKFTNLEVAESILRHNSSIHPGLEQKQAENKLWQQFTN